MTRGWKGWISLCVLPFVVACSQNEGFDDLDRFMKEAREQPRGHVEPLPEFKAYEAFSYSAADRRSPFEPPVEVQLTMVDEQAPKSDVKPNLDRPKEVLENFQISQLTMVGTLQRPNGDGELFALIRDNTGGVHRVTEGNYMGQNYGRVVGVNETRIELVEIVPNGQGGWVKRPRSLSLNEG
ncbi:type IV pilus assembly protein PilP [Tamilnaduibacter salinus]|uniref:Pilus assembly protein PilP n=1 Tax=Tamilnaduibacter salinus TaxID=1484056 RepID=A0A2A2I103_9GAMM|nr:pilus assembly protein PilP [Tamilnaduibacter salinus]PAV24966.1 pilus assembly protein PilP [Tamilnaduibacter salinus]PVY70378.1 type IV pilus assembly protein PilP [Tamilnaduibacter salinus]